MRTIMIKDTVYEKLAKMKDGKSFSELLEELAERDLNRKREAFRKMAGMLTKSEVKEMKKRIEEMRKMVKVRTYEISS